MITHLYYVEKCNDYILPFGPLLSNADCIDVPVFISGTYNEMEKVKLSP